MCLKISLASRGDCTRDAASTDSWRRAPANSGRRPPPRSLGGAGGSRDTFSCKRATPYHIYKINPQNQNRRRRRAPVPRARPRAPSRHPPPWSVPLSFSLTSEPQHAPAHEKGPQPGQARSHSPGGSWCSEHRVRTRSTADCARRLPMPPGGHDVVHTATPAEPAVRSPLPIATGLSIDANAWCQAVKPPAPWSEYGAEPQQVVGGGGVRGGGMSMPPTT